MIICFSGTGNSRRVADILQDCLGDELIRFAPGQMRAPSRVNLEVYDDRVIWVLPVHAWGLPSICEETFKYANIHGKQQITHYLVCTCGDDIGYTDKFWRDILKARGWKTGSAFSVQMPNTYVFMKGFDTDPEDVAEKKLSDAEKRVEYIAERISEDDVDTVDVVRGSWPKVKSYIIRPWFARVMTRTKPFHATDACKSCGICARNCPLGIISMNDGHPKWHAGHCVMCLRCYHGCPNHAVAYGTATKGKGQYLCPGFSLKK